MSIVLLPLIAALTGAMPVLDGSLTGIGIAAVIAILTLIGMVKSHVNRSYEAEVIDKQYGETVTGNTRGAYYRTIVKTVDGRRKEIVETCADPASAYEYLAIGVASVSTQILNILMKNTTKRRTDTSSAPSAARKTT